MKYKDLLKSLIHSSGPHVSGLRKRKQIHGFVDSHQFISGQDSIQTLRFMGESHDCVVRALSAVTYTPYDDTHAFVEDEFKRPHRRGTVGTELKLINCAIRKPELLIQDDPYLNFTQTFDHHITEVIIAGKYKECYTSTIAIQELMSSLGATINVSIENNHRYNRPNTSPTIDSFIETHPKGKWLCLVRGHALAIIDGVLVDNVSRRYNGWRRPIEIAYRLESL